MEWSALELKGSRFWIPNLPPPSDSRNWPPGWIWLDPFTNIALNFPNIIISNIILPTAAPLIAWIWIYSHYHYYNERSLYNRILSIGQTNPMSAQQTLSTSNPRPSLMTSCLSRSLTTPTLLYIKTQMPERRVLTIEKLYHTVGSPRGKGKMCWKDDRLRQSWGGGCETRT